MDTVLPKYGSYYPQPKPLTVVFPGNGEKSTRICAKELAEEVQRKLDPKYPSFVKSLVRSNVGSSFILSLPAEFCNLYLPKQNITVTLVDENKKTCSSNFIYKRKGLSAGWGGFSTSHKLLEGDVLVFQLVKPDEFQVYIIRQYGSSGVDRDLGLQNMGGPTKKRRNNKKDRSVDVKPKINESGSRGHLSEKSALENGSKLFGEVALCKNLERKDFDHAIYGLKKNSDFNDSTWTQYYELCHSQKTLLHRDLVDCSYKLVGAIIYEVVKIADEMKNSNLNTSRDEYSVWSKKLRAFGLMGMNVGFMHDKLQKLLSFYLDGERVS